MHHGPHNSPLVLPGQCLPAFSGRQDPGRPGESNGGAGWWRLPHIDVVTRERVSHTSNTPQDDIDTRY